jgi:hypothetical protein
MIDTEINKVVDEFFHAMAIIQHKQRTIKKSTKREIEHLDKNKTYEGTDNYDVNLFTYNCPYENLRKPFKTIKTTLREYMREAYLHKNKQYQWLLAEAYELFEDYLEKLYALSGRHDNSFWQARHFGNISISDISACDYNWFMERVDKIQGKPQSILKQIKLKVPEIKIVEGKHREEIRLFFTVILIEKLRHIIVHNRGIVKDKEKFIDLILRESKYNESSEEVVNKAKALINMFFGVNEYSNHIFLSEIPIEFPLSCHINRHEILINELAGYYKLIADCLKDHFKKDA